MEGRLVDGRRRRSGEGEVSMSLSFFAWWKWSTPGGSFGGGEWCGCIAREKKRVKVRRAIRGKTGRAYGCR